MIKRSFVFILVILMYACNSKPKAQEVKEEVRKTVEMVTDYGTIVLELYNETPLHRDNFIKLAKEGVYDSVLFHRVIKNFMVQGGDPYTRPSATPDTLENDPFSYQVDAEFVPELYHKKGALAAARTPNMERSSSSTQFYIVQGKVYNDDLLNRAEGRINDWLSEHYFKNDPSNKSLVDSLQKAIDGENWKKYGVISDSISKMAKAYRKFERYTIPEEHREVYKTEGGIPFLDQNYTVYGQVIQGLEVIDSIAVVRTDTDDKPVDDIRVLSVKVLD